MKKTVFRILFVATFTMAASYNVYALQQEVEMPDLAIANVDALSKTETSGSSCYYQITYDCMEVSYIVPWRPVGIFHPDHYGN